MTDAELIDNAARLLRLHVTVVPEDKRDAVIAVARNTLRRLLELAREAHERREWLAGVQRTHHAECWRSHHECAVARVEELQAYIDNERT